MKYAIDSPEVNPSYFWCYLVWHNQICTENQLIYLCSGQLKNLNPIWPFLRCSRRKTDSFFLERGRPLLSILQPPERFHLCFNSRVLNGLWQICSLACGAPEARKLEDFICFILRCSRKFTLRKMKERRKANEKGWHNAPIHHTTEAEINPEKLLTLHHQPTFP